jgi:hypothetical protein
MHARRNIERMWTATNIDCYHKQSHAIELTDLGLSGFEEAAQQEGDRVQFHCSFSYGHTCLL